MWPLLRSYAVRISQSRCKCLPFSVAFSVCRSTSDVSHLCWIAESISYSKRTITYTDSFDLYPTCLYSRFYQVHLIYYITLRLRPAVTSVTPSSSALYSTPSIILILLSTLHSNYFGNIEYFRYSTCHLLFHPAAARS